VDIRSDRKTGRRGAYRPGSGGSSVAAAAHNRGSNRRRPGNGLSKLGIAWQILRWETFRWICMSRRLESRRAFVCEAGFKASRKGVKAAEYRMKPAGRKRCTGPIVDPKKWKKSQSRLRLLE
jgi:hypothetical protein